MFGCIFLNIYQCLYWFHNGHSLSKIQNLLIKSLKISRSISLVVATQQHWPLKHFNKNGEESKSQNFQNYFKIIRFHKYLQSLHSSTNFKRWKTKLAIYKLWTPSTIIVRSPLQIFPKYIVMRLYWMLVIIQ